MWELGTNCTLVKGLKQEFVVGSISNTCVSITRKICFFSDLSRRMSTNRYGKDTTFLVSDTENSQMTCIMKKRLKYKGK